MHTRPIGRGRGRPVHAPFTAIAFPLTALPFAAGENALWLAVLLAPALIVFSLHLLLLGLWQRVVFWRLRKHVDAALTRGEARSIRQAAAETAEAERDWPGSVPWVLRQALEVGRRRTERTSRC